MKITKTHLKQMIKEELGSFFSPEREAEESYYVASKREFRKFRDITNGHIEFLQDLQRDKETLDYVSQRLRKHDPNFDENFSQWQRMLAKLIQGRKQNLKIATGPKGTHSGESPLSEAASRHMGPLDYDNYREFREGGFNWYHDSPKDFTDGVASILKHIIYDLRPYSYPATTSYVSKNFIKFIENLEEQTIKLGRRYMR